MRIRNVANRQKRRIGDVKLMAAIIKPFALLTNRNFYGNSHFGRVCAFRSIIVCRCKRPSVFGNYMWVFTFCWTKYTGPHEACALDRNKSDEIACEARSESNILLSCLFLVWTTRWPQPQTPKLAVHLITKYLLRILLYLNTCVTVATYILSNWLFDVTLIKTRRIFSTLLIGLLMFINFCHDIV